MSEGVYAEQRLLIGARSIYANYTLSMVEVGIHVFMAVYGLSVFMETPQHLRKGRKRYIVISFLITTLRALTGSLDMAWHFQQLFPATSTMEYFQLMMMNWRVWYRILSDVSMNVVILLGEALLVYRCWIICIGYRWVAILPACTCTTAFILLATLWGRADEPGNSTTVATASQLLTVSTNIIVTSLIIFHLIRARRSLAKVLPSTETAHLYTGVVAILIESAFPLCVLGIIAAAFEQSQDNAPATPGFTVGFYLFTGLFYSFCALSPHMIIFRVTTGRSWLTFPTSRDSAVSNPINFAHHTAESSFMRTTSGQESSLVEREESDRTPSARTPTIEEKV